MFSISNLDKGIVSSGSWRSKFDVLCILNRLFVVLINLFFLLCVRFSFSINGKRSFLCECCFTLVCWVLFFIHCEYGIGLKVDVPSR